MNDNMRKFVRGLMVGAVSKGVLPKKREPVAYLYNGVRLPPLPEWDRETYPYAYICYGESAVNAYFYLSSVPMLVKTTAGFSWLYATANGSGVKYITSPAGTGKWQHFEDVTFTADTQVFGRAFTALIWTNSSINNYADGTLYMDASDPIPVYE